MCITSYLFEKVHNVNIIVENRHDRGCTENQPRPKAGVHVMFLLCHSCFIVCLYFATEQLHLYFLTNSLVFVCFIGNLKPQQPSWPTYRVPKVLKKCATKERKRHIRRTMARGESVPQQRWAFFQQALLPAFRPENLSGYRCEYEQERLDQAILPKKRVWHKFWWRQLAPDPACIYETLQVKTDRRSKTLEKIAFNTA